MTTNTTADDVDPDAEQEPVDEGPDWEDAPVSLSDPPATRLADIAGLDHVTDTLQTAVIDPLIDDARVARTHGVLITGPTGSGKTTITNAVAGELSDQDFTVARVDAGAPRGPDRDAITNIVDFARAHAPCVLIFDPLHGAIMDPIRDALTAQVRALNASQDRVLILASMSQNDMHHPMGQEYDTFEVTIPLDAPNETRRQALIQRKLAQLAASDTVAINASDIDFPGIAVETEGLTAAQVETVCERALHEAASSKEASEVVIDHVHLDTAARAVTAETTGQTQSRGPADWRENVFEPGVPEVSFDDIGGLDDVKARLREHMEFPIEHAHLYDAFDIPAGHGILLHGPPGNGKTMLAKALANETDRAFLAVKGPELKNAYVGRTERNIREVFEQARERAPSVLFLDEFDALAPSREDVGRATYKVDFVNALLTELDGLTSDEDVLVVAATNRIDAIDDAALRPGRLGDHIEITTPDSEGRKAIVNAVTMAHPLADDVTPEWVATELPDGISGAQTAAVCRGALHRAIREAAAHGTGVDAEDVRVTQHHVLAALSELEPTGTDDAQTRGYV